MLPVKDMSQQVPIDLEALKRTLVRRANEEVPAYIKRMSTSELISESKRLAAERPEYPGLNWAHRLLSRIADGENIPPIAEQMAKAATRYNEPPEEIAA